MGGWLVGCVCGHNLAAIGLMVFISPGVSFGLIIEN